MFREKISFVILFTLIGLIMLVTTGCGPRPPIPYQTLQVQDSSESVGYDVYMYVAVTKEIPAGDVTALLEWFRDEKFSDVNRIKIFVWNNPQSALLSAMGDMIATLDVDRENEVDEIKIIVHSR